MTTPASASGASVSAHCSLACCYERPQLQRPQLQRKGLLLLENEMLTLLQLLSCGTGGSFSSERNGAGV